MGRPSSGILDLLARIVSASAIWLSAAISVKTDVRTREQQSVTKKMSAVVLKTFHLCQKMRASEMMN